MRRASLWPLLLVAGLLVALGILAALQVHWVSEAMRGQEQRIHAELHESGMRLTEDFTHEMMQAVSAFEIHDATEADIARAYDRWAATARDARLIAGVSLLEPPDHRTLRRFDPVTRRLGPPVDAETDGDGMSLRIPVRTPRRPFDERAAPALLVDFDRAYAFGVLVPSLARRYFHTDSVNGYDVAVMHDARVVYRSNPSWPETSASANPDLATPLLLPMMRHEREPVEHAHWMIVARHHGLPLTAILAHERTHALTVALAIVGILGCSLLLLAWTAHRADRLRRQQLEFIAGITHELHTPLAALATAGQNLADGVHVDTAKYGATIVKEARRLTDLVDGVLEFSGMEAGRNGHATAPVDVRDVIGDAVLQCGRLADESGVRIETASDAALPLTQCDRAALTRAVQNLVANAIRHGGEGGWVGVRAIAENGDVLIKVADRGPGIAAADIHHLFEPFYRGRNAQTRGSGLGLAIVDRVARAHGGSVTATNLPERGAEFTLRLPVGS